MAKSIHTRISIRALLLGNLLMVISTILTGTDFSVVKLVAPRAASGNDVTSVSIIGACALFWIVSLFCKCQPLQRRDAVRVLVGGGLLVWLFVFLFNMALALGNPVDVAVVNTLTPVFIAGFAIIFLHARVGWVQASGLIIGLGAAIAVIIGASGAPTVHAKNNLLGVILGLASCLGYAVYLMLMTGPLQRYSVVSLLRWVFLAASVPALFFIPSFAHAPIWHLHELTPWLSLIFITTCPMFLAYILVNRSIDYMGSELTGLYDYFLPVVSVGSSLILGVITEVSALQIVAMSAVVVGMVLTILGKRRDDPT